MSENQNKIYSSKQENQIAKYLDWKVVSGSGARFCPGDVISEMWLGECKTHNRPGYKIEFRASTWNKIYLESVSLMKKPVYFVDDGSQNLTSTWVMFPWLPLQDVSKFKYPGRVGSSIRFDSENLKHAIQLFETASSNSGKSTVFELIFNKDTVWMTTIDRFLEILQEV